MSLGKQLLRLRTWWWRWKLDRKVRQMPPLEEFVPETPPVGATVNDAALGALVAALQETGAAAMGAAVGVSLRDRSLWVWATDANAYGALGDKCFLGGKPDALLAAWMDEDETHIRLYCLLSARQFRDVVAALGRAVHT